MVCYFLEIFGWNLRECHYTSEKVTKNHKFKHLRIFEPIDPLMVVLSASNTSFIHKVLERYNANQVDVNKVHKLYSIFMMAVINGGSCGRRFHATVKLDNGRTAQCYTKINRGSSEKTGER